MGNGGYKIYQAGERLESLTSCLSIDTFQFRGQPKGLYVTAPMDDAKCPNEAGYSWRFGDLLAGRGLVVKCTDGEASQWLQYQGLDCYQGHGGDPIHPDPLSDALSLSECKKACEADNSCEGIVTQLGSEASGLCYKRRNLDLSKCVQDPKWNLFIKTGSPGGNHVGISVPSKRIN